MIRNYCFVLGIVFAMGVAPHIAEAQGIHTCGAQATCAGQKAWGAFTTEAFVRHLCGLGFVELSFTGCLLTCLMPSRHGRRKSKIPQSRRHDQSSNKNGKIFPSAVS